MLGNFELLTFWSRYESSICISSCECFDRLCSNYYSMSVVMSPLLVPQLAEAAAVFGMTPWNFGNLSREFCEGMTNLLADIICCCEYWLFDR